MKKGFLVTLALALLLGTAGCSGTTQAGATSSVEETELIVFAAASLSTVLSEIAAHYTAQHPQVTIRFNFDSSGTLRTQIQEGAAADVFLSAATHEMDELEAAGHLQNNTRLDFLENQAVLITAPRNPQNIQSFACMKSALLDGNVLLAIGNMDVPAGRYAAAILTYLGLDHTMLAQSGVITYASNVREVAMQVREGSADIGIVYLSDALDFALSIADTATPSMVGRVIYPAAVLQGSQQADAAQSFLNFLMGEAATIAFVNRGFLPIAQEG